MKNPIRHILLIVALALAGLVLPGRTLLAQDEGATEEQSLIADEQADNPEISIPFIDRDGDGINDLLQNGWGLRFINRYKKRQALWEQLNVAIVIEDDKRLVDTDGDGNGDIPFKDYMKQQMNVLIDTDGDGDADTPLREHLRKRFQSFDSNSDGLPDEFTPEDIKKYMQEMKEWRNQIRDRVFQGLPPFIDENNDGVPDDLPSGFGGRRSRQSK